MREIALRQRHEQFLSGGALTIPSARTVSNRPLPIRTGKGDAWGTGNCERYFDLISARKRERAWLRDCRLLEQGKWDRIATSRFVDFIHALGASSQLCFSELQRQKKRELGHMYRERVILEFEKQMNA